jgi:hypothetical protein
VIPSTPTARRHLVLVTALRVDLSRAWHTKLVARGLSCCSPLSFRPYQAQEAVTVRHVSTGDQPLQGANVGIASLNVGRN